MNNMNFEECEVSGQMFARGTKGDYWIEEGAWCKLTIVKVDAAGPNLSKIGTYNTLEDAITAANLFDESEVDNG